MKGKTLLCVAAVSASGCLTFQARYSLMDLGDPREPKNATFFWILALAVLCGAGAGAAALWVAFKWRRHIHQDTEGTDTPVPEIFGPPVPSEVLQPTGPEPGPDHHAGRRS
jgi:hypothetical protein